MKKIGMLLAALMTTAVLFMTTGCEEVTNVVNDATANKWWECQSNTQTASASVNGTTTTFSKMYLYYDSDDTNVIIVAATDNYYIKRVQSFGDSRWAGLAVAAFEQGKIKTATDPTKNKTEISTETNWGNLAAEALITTLLGGEVTN